MESSIETSRTGDASKPKPTLPPKPRLTPKPFSLQKNNTIRSIHAPKTVTATSKSTTSQTGKSEVTNVPKPTLTTLAQRSPQKTTTSESQPTPVSVQPKDQPKTTKEKKTSPQGDDTLDSSVALGKSDPASQTTPTKQTPKSTPVQKEDVIQTNHKESADIVTNSQQKDKEKKGAETVTQKPEESANDSSSTANSTYEWGGTRKRLPSELTSKFESGGPPLSPLPSPSKTNTKYDVSKPVTPDPELSQTAPEPSNKESDEEAPKENYTGGGSIKRRISLLFDSSSRPEVMVKKDEPEIITGGVKERIKNWAAETSFEAPEKKPQVTLQSRSKSFDSAPAAEKTPKMPPVEAPTPEKSSSQTLQPSKKIFTAKQPAETQAETSKDVVEKPLGSSTETPGESEHDKSPRAEVQLRNRSPSTAQTVSDEQDSASSESGQCALKRNNVKRRSVRFGIVETDDGEPPVILGSASESSSEEETCEDQAEVGTTPSVPVYRRVFQNKDNEAQKQEEKQQKHQEFEKALKAEESTQARLTLEQERKLEEEKVKEKARQEELRLREEEKQREAERERERLKLEERERLRREEWQRERLKEEERERTRLREEEMERERQMELMRQKLKEEERERAKQKEERLKQDQEERAKERLKEERERQKLRAVEERLTHEHMGHTLKETLRVEEINKDDEKEWVNNTVSLRGEDEREREKELELMWQRQKEESRERARQAEERLRQEEWEKERLRQEAEEREREKQRKEAEERMRERERQAEEERQRRELERRMQQEKEEVERIRKIELQREVERREEEWRRQLEKERVEELEKKMQEELARKRAQELEEKLRLNAESLKEALASTNLQERAVDEPESYLINFDSEDLSHFPLAKSCQPTESQNDVLYDDFSVRKPVIEVEFDDFSVKPKRWGSQPKAKTQPVQSWDVDSINKDEMEALVPLHVSRQENVLSEQVAKPDSPEPTAAMGSPEEDEEEEKEVEKEEDDDESPGEIQLISFKVRDEEREIVKEDEVDIEDIEEEDSEDDMEETEVNSYNINGDDDDADALIDSEPDQQNGGYEQMTITESPELIPDQPTEVSSPDVDSTNFHREAELAPFPENSAPLLDNSAQRSKVDLGRRRSRSRPSRSLRVRFAQKESLEWRDDDSTDGKVISSKFRDSDSDEEQPKPKIVCSPPPSSQRVPMFPGLNPAALLAQIKKKTGGSGAEEDKGNEEKEMQQEEVAPSPSQNSRSPRPAARLAGAARVLPPIGGTDGGATSSPAWLKELKSKKRLSHHESEA